MCPSFLELRSKLRAVYISNTDLNRIAQQLGIRPLEKPRCFPATAEEVVRMITEQTREDYLAALNNFINVLNIKMKGDLGKKLETIKKVPHYLDLGNKHSQLRVYIVEDSG